MRLKTVQWGGESSAFNIRAKGLIPEKKRRGDYN